MDYWLGISKEGTSLLNCAGKLVWEVMRGLAFNGELDEAAKPALEVFWHLTGEEEDSPWKSHSFQPRSEWGVETFYSVRQPLSQLLLNDYVAAHGSGPRNHCLGDLLPCSAAFKLAEELS